MNRDMFDKINNTLAELEKQKDIQILYAAESGSRGWGFASPDSDYDCRFIYIRNRSFYLRIHEGVDYIELPVDAVYDVNGWDLKKVLKAAEKSNPTILEWLQSPIIYREKEGFRETLLELYDSYFNEKAVLHHYRNIAAKKLQDIEVNEEEVLKKYFYVLRPLLACEYVMNHHKVPPMAFDALYERKTIDKKIGDEIEKIMALKVVSNEKFKIPRNEMLVAYLEELLARCDNYLMQADYFKKKHDEELNQFFLKWVERDF